MDTTISFKKNIDNQLMNIGNRKAIEMGPHYEAALYNCAVCYNRFGKYKNMFKDLEKQFY